MSYPPDFGASAHLVGADRLRLRRYAALSIAAALVTLALKSWAAVATDSVSLFSDAVESLVNLGAAVLAWVSLTLAARPPDEGHAYGHDKVEFFAAGLEGALIVLAAAAIAWAGVDRLLYPAPVERLGFGLVLTTVATLINATVGGLLIRRGRAHQSPTLEADGQHLMTDVATGVAVLGGLGLAHLTGWMLLDPLLALVVAAIVAWAGARLVLRSLGGLMDEALPEADQQALRSILDRYCASDHLDYHALRTRRSGARRFASVHVLVPGDWSVQRGHELLERMEADLRDALPNLTILTHLEPIEDPAAHADIPLDRG
jgi:cation diffusion facilitator family transporter